MMGGRMDAIGWAIVALILAASGVAYGSGDEWQFYSGIGIGVAMSMVAIDGLAWLLVLNERRCERDAKAMRADADKRHAE
jgi:hypothetical protein